jgi:hypothetical protein
VQSVRGGAVRVSVCACVRVSVCAYAGGTRQTLRNEAVGVDACVIGASASALCVGYTCANPNNGERPAPPRRALTSPRVWPSTSLSYSG